jgi:hypothetical protein
MRGSFFLHCFYSNTDIAVLMVMARRHRVAPVTAKGNLLNGSSWAVSTENCEGSTAAFVIALVVINYPYWTSR